MGTVNLRVVPELVISDKILQLQHEALKLADKAVLDSGATRRSVATGSGFYAGIRKPSGTVNLRVLVLVISFSFSKKP